MKINKISGDWIDVELCEHLTNSQQYKHRLARKKSLLIKYFEKVLKIMHGKNKTFEIVGIKNGTMELKTIKRK